MSDVTPNRGIDYIPEGAEDIPAATNVALNKIDALIGVPRVTSMSLTAPPGSPTDGVLYIIAASPTGAWSGYAKYMARYVSAGAFWQFYTPGAQVNVVQNLADGKIYQYDGSAWALISVTSGGILLQVALSDLTTSLTTGTNNAYIRAPKAFTITEVRTSLATASSSGLVTVDINKNGSTILSTKLSIDASEKTSKTAATPPVLSGTAVADDDELTFDIDAAGTGAKGLVVTIIGS